MKKFRMLILIASFSLISGTSAQTQKSVTGHWHGSWVNSKGDKGTSTFNLTEAADGTITGDEDGVTGNTHIHRIIEDGRRTGNYLAWNYSNQNNGCRDYAVAMKLSDDGNTLIGRYTVADQCAKPSTYTGQYLSFTMTGAGQTKTSGGTSCFAGDPGVGNTARNGHLDWARQQTSGVLESNLNDKISLLFRCASLQDDKLAQVFADISVYAARYVPNADCFNGDRGVVSTDRSSHYNWARSKSREEMLKNLQWKVSSALRCLDRNSQNEFFADVSVVVAGSGS